MQTQQSRKVIPTIKTNINDEWEDIGTTKYGNPTSAEQVSVRMVGTESGATSITITIGKTILDLYGLKKESRVRVLRRSSNPTLIKVIGDDSGNVLINHSSSGDDYINLRVTITIAIDKKKAHLSQTMKCDYETADDGIIIDISPLLK